MIHKSNEGERKGDIAYVQKVGWRDSWYWVFSMLERIARDDEAAAVDIRERMAALQDEICASGITGNPAAEICWHTALDLLSEFGR